MMIYDGSRWVLGYVCLNTIHPHRHSVFVTWKKKYRFLSSFSSFFFFFIFISRLCLLPWRRRSLFCFHNRSSRTKQMFILAAMQLQVRFFWKLTTTARYSTKKHDENEVHVTKNHYHQHRNIGDIKQLHQLRGWRKNENLNDDDADDDVDYKQRALNIITWRWFTKKENFVFFFLPFVFVWRHCSCFTIL